MSDDDHCHVCPICGETSDQPHQIHYGGVACFSCRAFFRRAHQKTREPKFVCKKGGDCEVTVKTRRKCQKCRYDLCVKSGMRPDAVLTDEQKKIRFRNMIRKKNARKSEAFVSRETVDTDSDSDDDDDNDHRRRRTSSSADDPQSFRGSETILSEARVKVELQTDESSEMGVISLDPLTVQFDTINDDFGLVDPTLQQLESRDTFSSSITTPNMSPPYDDRFLNPTSPFTFSATLSPSTNTTRFSPSPRSRLSSRSTSNLSSTSVSPYSSPLQSVQRSCISSPCCQSSPESAASAPKISIGGFNKKKMAMNAYKVPVVHLMPCYNYCPIANTGDRGRPGQDKAECRGGFDESSSDTQSSGGSRLKPNSRELRKSCPMMGDIEVWPPIYDHSDVELQHANESEDPRKKPNNSGHSLFDVGSSRFSKGKVMFGSEDLNPEDEDSFSSRDRMASWKTAFKPAGEFALGNTSPYSNEGAYVAPETDDLKEEDRFRVGEGPYTFDVRSIPPAPSVQGRMQVEKLIHAYNISGSQMEIDPEFISRLFALHRNHLSFPRGLFKTFIISLAQQFRHFAIQHKKFLTLHKADQRKLLARNSALFVQYMLGKYFSAATGEEQISWLLGSRAPDLSSTTDLHRVTLHEFNASVKLFRKGSYVDMYDEFANRLATTNTEPKFNPVMAHFFLFSFDFSDRFSDPDTIAGLHSDSFKMCPHSRHYLLCSQQPNITGVLETCEAMASFFSTNTVWSDSPLDSDDVGSSGSESELTIQHELGLPYTQEEENWISEQFRKFNEAYSSVPLGEDIIKEYVMYAYDVPVSKHFMPFTLSVVNERFRRILAMHSEVEQLSASERTRLCQANTMNAVALFIAKMESCKNAAQQFQFAFGALDDTIFEREYSHVIKASKMRKLSLFDTNKSTNLLTDRMIADVERLVAKIAPIIIDFETFRLLSIITLFTGVGDTIPSMAKLRNRYLSVLKRRPFRVNKKMKLEVTEMERNRAIYRRYTSCLCDIQELATLMQKLRSSLPESFSSNSDQF